MGAPDRNRDVNAAGWRAAQIYEVIRIDFYDNVRIIVALALIFPVAAGGLRLASLGQGRSHP